MIATLNGKASLPLDDGAELVAETDDAMRRLTLRLDRDGDAVWATAPLDVGPEPTRLHSTSTSADYLAIAWPEAGVVVVLGESSAVAIDAASGEVRTSFSLEFTGKESLEQVGLTLAADNGLLVVTSTKRAWVVTKELQPLLRYDPRFILASPPRVDRGCLVIEEYDFDSDRELVTQRLDL